MLRQQQRSGKEYLTKKETLIPIKEIPLPESDLYEIWDKTENELLSLTKIFLANVLKEGITITTFAGNEWTLENKKDIKSPTNKIQNIFYIKKINQILLPDETAYYIYGINPDDGIQMLCLYRGKNPGFITSISLLNKNYLAVNNLNRTIHIFDIGNNSNNYNISNMIGNFIYGNYISPTMRIPYDKITKKNEGEFYESDFIKKGAILDSEDEGIELKIIAYNGYAYKLKINFLKKDFEIILKEKLSKYKIYETNEISSNENKESELFTNYNSIFDQNKKEKKDEEKFVVFH